MLGREESFCFGTTSNTCINASTELAVSDRKSDVVYGFYRPAHFSRAVEKLQLVLVRGDEEKLLCGKRRIPRHAQWHSTLLNTLRA